MLPLQLPSPLQEIKSSLLKERKIQLFMKREDLIHPIVSGNKWRKLNFNLAKAIEEGHSTILSFGGAYSNHIHAMAAASEAFGLKSIAIIRGEEMQPLNGTLAYAKSCGMKLHFVTREEYKMKTNEDFILKLREQFGEFYLIPEGGRNAEGVKGCTEIVKEIDIEFDCICTACGTGTTMAGLVNSLAEDRKAIGFPVLKGGDFLYRDINDLLSEVSIMKKNHWHLETNYHFGGYAKWNNELLSFMNNFEKEHNIPLDPIYTGKMMYGLFDLIHKGFFIENTTVIALHTGGLQGLIGLK
ncbi:MAG TPA: pyridoxal-phosphate dependent enzyme [Cytophagaceae bacterium]|nr:pyridoxal-phosphate dependent enzyme [Cytophagaceae bacterium]